MCDRHDEAAHESAWHNMPSRLALYNGRKYHKVGIFFLSANSIKAMRAHTNVPTTKCRIWTCSLQRKRISQLCDIFLPRQIGPPPILSLHADSSAAIGICRRAGPWPGPAFGSRAVVGPRAPPLRCIHVAQGSWGLQSCGPVHAAPDSLHGHVPH